MASGQNVDWALLGGQYEPPGQSTGAVATAGQNDPRKEKKCLLVIDTPRLKTDTSVKKPSGQATSDDEPGGQK